MGKALRNIGVFFSFFLCSYKFHFMLLISLLLLSFADKALALYLFCCSFLLILKLTKWSDKSNSIESNDYHIFRINCSKIEFARAVIKWCMQNLDQNTRKTIYLNLKYYKRQKLMGSYNYLTKTITIYYGSHESIESLVDTIIHEYYHSMEIVKKKDQVEYDKLTFEKTYYNNPFEIRARKVAAENRAKCILDLSKSKYLVRC